MSSSALAPSVSVVTHTDKKGAKFMSIVSAQYDKARMDEDEAQLVNNTPGLAKLVAIFIAENRRPKKYASEEVCSNYTYPPEYKAKPIEEQIKGIALIWSLDSTSAIEFAKNLPPLPEGAEGWFAIPSLSAIAKKHFPEVTDQKEQYCRAVTMVLEMIAATRAFFNWRQGELTPDRLRISTRTAEALAKLEIEQQGEILIVAAQLGLRHRGRSARRAREAFINNEFGLGTLAVSSILLVHPERLVRWQQLHMAVSGDEFDFPGSDVRFDHTPVFCPVNGGTRFDTLRFGIASDVFGSASGFFPQ